MPFQRTAAPMPQVNFLNRMQDKYQQTPYIVHNPNGSFYNERGYTPYNMQQMVQQGLGEYYSTGPEGGQTRLPQVTAQPPNAGPGGGYQWNQYNNVWQDQSKTGSWRPGAGGNYWGAQYGQRSPNFNRRQTMQGMPAGNQQQAMNLLNQYFRNR